MIGLVVDNTATGNIIKLDTLNLSDIASTFRSLADDIEAGKVGHVDRAIMILVGEDGEPLTLGCGRECNRIVTLGTMVRAIHLFNQSLNDIEDD